MNDEFDTPRVRRRRHSAEFKNQVINACLQPEQVSPSKIEMMSMNYIH
ncbi:hypothetical protein H8K47_01625 [Undibacterium sp. CY7W]|uniref:Transposase n=1 Tax=Undibacterium rugosum TaxID=2762291 RepID=A0A923I5Q0_9BURK|nr:hypothetical protein [Undibacterium rugosum]MBC3934048.1 hypothetical protein [Undibacterium rugosum]